MSHKIEPATITYYCDACKLESDEEFDCQLTVHQVSRDFQGDAVGANNVTHDLCSQCVTKFNQFFMDARK